VDNKPIIILVLTLSLALCAIMPAACLPTPQWMPIDDELSTSANGQGIPDASKPEEEALAEDRPESEPKPQSEPVVLTLTQQEGSVLPEGFSYLDDAIICEIRYATSYNFIGTRIDGYEKPVGIISNEAAQALHVAVQLASERGLRLKAFDAYRPYRAHLHFVRWGNDASDTLMQAEFYPGMTKEDLFRGYIGYYGDPHTRGSTVDVTLVNATNGRELDMGSPFDLFGPISHYYSPDITPEQRANRQALREIMTAAGFVPYDGEWWEFTLAGEPYPHTHFDFPVA